MAVSWLQAGDFAETTLSFCLSVCTMPSNLELERRNFYGQPDALYSTTVSATQGFALNPMSTRQRDCYKPLEWRAFFIHAIE